MRKNLTDIADRNFDVVIIGGGINGSVSAHYLAAEGYSVLLVEKADFGAGSSSRSSRMLASGVGELAPESSRLREFLYHPSRAFASLRYARMGMKSRADFVKSSPQRVRAFKFGFPIYHGSSAKSWQVDAAFKLLTLTGDGGVPLNYKLLKQPEALSVPLFAQLRAPNKLKSVALFTEYQFNWPERIVVDEIISAEEIGATVRNYTEVTRLERIAEGWELSLDDKLDSSSQAVKVRAKSVFNMAGIWIDQVNKRAEPSRAPKLISPTKGVHVLVRLTPEYQDYGIYTFSQRGHNLHFYIIPWGNGLHYVGPTHIPYDGSIDEVRATESDIELVLAESNYHFPGLTLQRSDVLYTWAGARPLTNLPQHPIGGAFSHTLHDLGDAGLPNMFAMTGASLGKHRWTGEKAVAALRSSNIKPSGSARPLEFGAKLMPHAAGRNNTAFDSAITEADIKYAVEREQAQTLSDILFRRTGHGWSADMGRKIVHSAADMLGAHNGWTKERVDEEVARYLSEVSKIHSAA